jgi:N-acetylglutamate synthase-like GNAT family acetyltransferase
VTSFSVRPAADGDGPWIQRFVLDRWGEFVVAHGEVVRPAEHRAFVAEEDGRPVGLVTYRMDAAGDCEVVTIDSLAEHRGIGTGLLEAVAGEARRSRARRVWLITTNDNLSALRFYQRRGFRLVGIRPNALEASRKLKPEISKIGEFGIPIRDELEMELDLAGGQSHAERQTPP